LMVDFFFFGGFFFFFQSQKIYQGRREETPAFCFHKDYINIDKKYSERQEKRRKGS